MTIIQVKTHKLYIIKKRSNSKFSSSCRHCGSHSSVASLIASDQWCLFCTPSLAIFPTFCHQLDSNVAKVMDTDEVGYILVFFSVTVWTMIARAQWAFQVLQGRNIIQVRWKTLHRFAANILGKRCIIFHSFMGWQETFWSPFCEHNVYYLYIIIIYVLFIITLIITIICNLMLCYYNK